MSDNCSFWRVEIDLDDSQGIKILVPIITKEEEDAWRVFDSFCRTLAVSGVVRIYAPERLLKDHYRVKYVAQRC